MTATESNSGRYNSVQVLSAEGLAEGEGMPFYISILEGSLLDAVRGWTLSVHV